LKNKKSFLLGLILIFGITIGKTTVSTDIEMAFPVSNLKLHSTLPSLSSSPYISDNLFQTKPSSIISSIINTNKIKIGFVTPIFTNAAYNHKFYIFYSRYALTPFGINITKDLSLLNSKITVSPNQGLSDRSQFAILSDLDIDKGNIFDNIDGSLNPTTAINLYDILILGHQEYVTQKEYDNLKQFVFNGGTMILLDGNVFYAEVKYNDHNNPISLVKGHGWAYNGKTAWRSIDERWKDETSQWVGSNYLCDLCIKSFKDNPFGYNPHEEQYITNPNDKIILNFEPIESSNAPSLKSKVSIAAYSLDYGKGQVISFGIYSDDVIHNSNFDRFFDNIIINSLLHRS
jgi:hypothetical protein